MKKLFYCAVAVALVVGFSGCSTTEPVDETVNVPTGAQRGGADTAGRGVARDGGIKGEALDEGSLLSRTTIYFDYDSSTVAPEFREVLRAHGDYLAANPSVRITIEGHTDERGTREYNLALGERRAYAVRQLLMLQGATASQLEVISFGEERPAEFGHDEAAWRLNRRAVLRYPARR